MRKLMQLLDQHFPVSKDGPKHHLVLTEKMKLGVVVNGEIRYFEVTDEEIRDPEKLVSDIRKLLEQE